MWRLPLSATPRYSMRSLAAMSGSWSRALLPSIGIGADIAIVNTYIGEMAPRQGQAKYASLIFLYSAAGAVVGVWLRLLLTTPHPSPSRFGEHGLRLEMATHVGNRRRARPKWSVDGGSGPHG